MYFVDASVPKSGCEPIHFHFGKIFRIAEQRRLEKQEERAAKQRVLDQIARDKADRAAKYNKKPETAAAPTPAPAAQAPPAEKKEYTECRLQVGVVLVASTQSVGSSVGPSVGPVVLFGRF